MKPLFLFPLLLLPLFTQAQKKDKHAEKFANTISAGELKEHLYIVAGPEMEGREAMSAGERRAAAYIEEHFRAIGLQAPTDRGYRQPFQVYSDSVSHAVLNVGGADFADGEDFIMLAGNYPFRMQAGEVVFAGYGISDSTRNDYAGIDARGKVVLVLDGLPAGAPRRYVNKQAAAASNGAAALLVVQEQFSPRLRSRQRGYPYLDAFDRTIPPNLAYISPAVVKALTGKTPEELQQLAQTPAAVEPFPTELTLEFGKETTVLPSANVFGFLEGGDLKDEVLVVTAHYDHVGKRDNTIFYGADDDGSGTVAVLEIAEAFAEAKKAGRGPRRSILFMTVSGEEKGLWGSSYYTDHPVYPLSSTVANLNIDMIGRTGSEYLEHPDSTNYVYIIGDDKLSSQLRPLSEGVNDRYTQLRLDYKYNDPKDPNRFYYRSDHYNFAEKGVPIIFYFNGTHADYHRPTDTPDKINYPLLAKRAQLVFHTAWAIANAEQRIVADKSEEKAD